MTRLVPRQGLSNIPYWYRGMEDRYPRVFILYSFRYSENPWLCRHVLVRHIVRIFRLLGFYQLVVLLFFYTNSYQMAYGWVLNGLARFREDGNDNVVAARAA